MDLRLRSQQQDLLSAVRSGDANAVRRIVGAEDAAAVVAGARTEAGETALYVAAENNLEEVFQLLVGLCDLDAAKARSRKDMNAFHAAAKQGHAGIVEELIAKGQQLDAINFAYEAGLQDKFPPIPLLKSFLEDSKVAFTVPKDENNSGQTVNANRRKQAALRAVIKCIEEHKLEAEYPVEDLQKKLENMEKAKVEKKKPSGGGGSRRRRSSANKRTRANNGGPMPPAKAGRLANHAYVSSFPAATTYTRSPSSYTTYSSAIPPPSHSSYPPSHTTYSSPVPPYPYDRPAVHGVYGSRSPPVIRDPYAYPTGKAPPAAIGVSYTAMNYPPYGGYGHGLAPGYQQAYYQ